MLVDLAVDYPTFLTIITYTSGDHSLQFHKAIKFISKVERIVNLNDRRMIEARHYINFHLHIGLFFLLLIANDLHSELLAGCLLLAQEDRSEAAATQLGEDCVSVGWILIVLDRDWSVWKRCRVLNERFRFL